MIGKDNGFYRRIFTFPAVYPCDSINPTTLLTSLTDLAVDICEYKSKIFSTNSKNARQIILLVSNLILFFDEIRVFTESGLPDSVLLCFSELHLDLQKIRFLLEDCTSEGARIWMAMKSDQVANQFRVLARGMGVALEVLPLWLLDIPIEVKELVELVKMQAQKARFEVEPDDKLVTRDVLLILNQFENGVAPDRNVIKEVLDIIGVQTWSDCNKEVKLLDTEIGFEYSNEEEKRRKLRLLSGLMGFITYSRCVLFDSIDIRIPQIDCNSSNQLLRCLNSDDFRCPISLEAMKDPVTIETGHTYDRSSILKWFRAGNRTCPNTGRRLETTELIPNLVLKGLIRNYCIENGIPAAESNRKNRDISKTAHPGSLAALKMVACFLVDKLANGDSVDKNKAAQEIRLLSKASIFNRSCLLEAGAIPYLLNLLLSNDSVCQENSIAGLLNLSKHSKSKALIVENGGIELIVHVLKKGLKMEAKQHGAATLFYLASIEEYRKSIGENCEAIPALLNLIKEGNHRATKNGLVAIFGLLMHPSNHWRVITAGAVPLLLTVLISSENEDIVTDCLAVFVSLAEKPDGAKAILSSGALLQIMGMLDSATSRAAKEQCVALLLALCINCGTDVVALLVKSPSLMVSLYSLMSDGTSRGSKKASTLIRILHEFHERSSSTSKTLVLPREHFVRAW
ncbi:U-box domain-containing protein 19 [Euphorbia lathyris]|uniref:U-box domain-containing protein 19 n=1 Tax=Euphorbia lathyris TaxID=212925 RepID=UPI003313BB3B